MKNVFCEMADNVLQDTNTLDIDSIKSSIEYLYGMRDVLRVIDSISARHVTNIITTLQRIMDDLRSTCPR